jgi:hypothetical protein
MTALLDLLCRFSRWIVWRVLGPTLHVHRNQTMTIRIGRGDTFRIKRLVVDGMLVVEMEDGLIVKLQNICADNIVFLCSP